MIGGNWQVGGREMYPDIKMKRMGSGERGGDCLILNVSLRSLEKL